MYTQIWKTWGSVLALYGTNIQNIWYHNFPNILYIVFPTNNDFYKFNYALTICTSIKVSTGEKTWTLKKQDRKSDTFEPLMLAKTLETTMDSQQDKQMYCATNQFRVLI